MKKHGRGKNKLTKSNPKQGGGKYKKKKTGTKGGKTKQRPEVKLEITREGSDYKIKQMNKAQTQSLHRWRSCTVLITISSSGGSDKNNILILTVCIGITLSNAVFGLCISTYILDNSCQMFYGWFGWYGCFMEFYNIDPIFPHFGVKVISGDDIF